MNLNIRQFITKLTPKGWAMIGGSVAVAIVFLMIVMNFASSKSYSTMITALDPAQTGKITSTLDAKGIGYQIQNGGTALAVDSSKVSQARIALATAGLLAARVGEQLGLGVGQYEVHLGRVDAVDLLDRLVELALPGALVGDLLLEVAGSEL